MSNKFNVLYSGLDDVVAGFGEIADWQGDLMAEELTSIGNAAPKRVREFTAGRRLARRMLREIGIQPCSIPVGRDRCPVWPIGVLGSISHTDEHVAVALARSGDYVTLGLDIESASSVTEDLVETVLTESERRRLDLAACPELATDVFCCKEAVYKAVFPAVREFLEFQDLEVELSGDEFTSRCLVDGRVRELVDQGRGYVTSGPNLVRALYLIR